ncbi:hypothetical protein V6N13_059933 [Hibiscus sabdariffa]|uniref:RNase H type-1 domain-containing protein n=1 Tax=Hibiscus sabdariffa TaxID=183260 RepID=A0ABR2GBQ9_9ROSI
MGWCIGSGQHVHIWSDSWLPEPHGGLVRGHSINHNYTLVSDLIDAHSATWKVEVLNSLFDSDLVKQVCSIPLIRTGLLTRFVGYPLLISRFYSDMWGVSLPAKCKDDVESIEHIMRERVFIKELLGAQGIHLASHSADAVWYARNKVVHEDLQPLVSNSLSFTLASLKEYDMLSVQCRTGPPPIQAKWKAPLKNEIKVNFDSVFNHQTMQSISGVICRDSAGLILAACSLPHKYVKDAFMAEALSCLQAVTFVWEFDFTRVVLEGDSRTVIQKCQSDSIDASLISPVIDDIKWICRSFMYVAFYFVWREANMVAHAVAQEGKSFD